MTVAGLLGIASPAFAADPQITDITVVPGSIGPGEQTTVQFTVRNNGEPPEATINISVTSDNPKVTCADTCSWGAVSFSPGQNKNYSPKFRVAQGTPIGPGEHATLTIHANGATQSQQLNLEQPSGSASVPEVSGEVVNVFDATPVPNATVYMQDSAGKNFETGTDSKGKFKFTSTTEKPIAAGALALRVEKDGWETAEKPIVASPGQPVTGQHLTLRPLNVSPSATLPGASPSGDVSPINGDGLSTTTPNEKEGGISWLLIVVGAVLVLLGIGAIALLFLRRRDEGDDDRAGPRKPPGRMPPGRGGPPGGPGGRPVAPTRRMPEGAMRGGPDPRRGPPPGRPVSPGPRGDQTLIARSPLADQPTMTHRPLPNEHADPYTTPGRHNGAPGGYGAPAGGYGGNPSSGYAGGHSYGQPSDPYAQPYPDPYATGQYEGYGQPGQGPDPRGRSGQPPANRRLDWLDD